MAPQPNKTLDEIKGNRMRNNKSNIIYSVRNITWNLKILIGYFTEMQKILTLCLTILMLSSMNIILSLPNSFSNSVSALSYQSEVGIGFTFNPTLSISLSSSDLVISNLVPGSSSDSNIINVSVLTNASHGYALAVNTNNEELVHNGSDVDNVFNSIATNADLENLTSDNTWGYSYRLSNSNKGSNNSNAWSTYNGLPLSTSTSTATTLINTDNQISKPIDFKIAAKASSTQASGTYTGTINFIAISKPTPKTIDDIVYMQTFGELVSTDLESVKNSMIKNTTYTLKDARDEQAYTVAKLEDGKIWMTKNLNLAGETEITAELSDVPEGYTLPTENGFLEGNRLPISSQEGFSNKSQAYVYNTGNNTDNCASPGCYSYYSWNAATAGSGVNIVTSNTDAPYSICPNGWRLPNSRSTIEGNSDFYQLAVAYGMNSNNVEDNSSSSGKNFSQQAGPNTIANFLITGRYSDSSFGQQGVSGRYWSSSSTDSTNSHYLFFGKGAVNSGGIWYRKCGFAVRCLAK